MASGVSMSEHDDDGIDSGAGYPDKKKKEVKNKKEEPVGDKPRSLTEKEMEIVTPWVDWLNSHIKNDCTLDAFTAAYDSQAANIGKLAPRLRDYVVKEKDMIVNLLQEKEGNK